MAVSPRFAQKYKRAAKQDAVVKRAFVVYSFVVKNDNSTGKGDHP